MVNLKQATPPKRKQIIEIVHPRGLQRFKNHKRPASKEKIKRKEKDHKFKNIFKILDV